jgi:hypothetical protein
MAFAAPQFGRFWPDSEMVQRPDGVRFLGYSGLVVLTASLSESDPGCVKTPASIMIPLVILGGEIDEAVRFGDGSCAIDAFARMP